MELDQSRGGAEFFHYAMVLLNCKGDIRQAQELSLRDGTLERVQRILRTAVAAGTTTNPDFSAISPDYATVANGFIESLRQRSVFDRLLDAGMRRLPLRSRIVAVVTGAQAELTPEGELKPVTQLALTAVDAIQPKKATCIVVVSDTILKMTRGGQALLANELRNGVASSTDAIFLTDVMSDAPEVASSGSTAANVLADIEALLDLVTTSATSVLYLVGSPATAKKLATKATTTGESAFPAMTPAGGEIAGIPFLVTDQAFEDTAGDAIALIDASALGGNSDTVVLDSTEQATLELDLDPQGGAGAVQVPLWQNDLKALRAERYFGFRKLRDTGFALLTGVSY